MVQRKRQKMDPMIDEELYPFAAGKERWPLSLPFGADALVRGIAAEQIFLELVDVIVLDKNHEDVQRPDVDHDFLLYLLKAFPQLVSKKHVLRWDNNETRELYPLSILSCLRAPAGLLKTVYEMYPDAISYAEPVKGTLSFHYLCTFLGGVESLEFFLATDPDCIKRPRTDGMYPLHLAAYFKASYEVVDLLARAWPEAVDHQDNGRWSILHASASGQATLEVVKRLYKLRPANILALDEKQRTPLHLACWRKGNETALSFLLEQAPNALHLQDESGETPLFRASRSQSLEGLKVLLPEGCPSPPLDELGASLLHFAMLDNTADVVEFLLNRFPEMAENSTTDRDGYLPIHGGSHFNCPVDNMRVLIRHAPRTLLIRNGHGKIPLETAQEKKASQELIDLLLEATMNQYRSNRSTLTRSIRDNEYDRYMSYQDARSNRNRIDTEFFIWS